MSSERFEYWFTEFGTTFFGSRPKEDYRAIIIEAGNNGWELVQVLIKARTNLGSPIGYELIFKRKIKD